MKNLFLTTLTLVVVLTSAYSQEYFSKGSNVITGNFVLGFSNNDSNNDNANSISESKTLGFSTTYGRFIKNNLSLGVGLGINKNSNEFSSTYSDSTFNIRYNEYNTISSNIFLRKHFPISEKFGAFLNTSIFYNFISSLNTSTSDVSEQTNEDSSNRLGLSAGLGIYYFVHNRFSLSLNIGFLNASTLIRETTNGTPNNLENRKSTNFQARFINQISLDQLFTINYHF
ncbi:MAG: outer membrane beta-barrel protein [Cyclobacteriaceae bacterium]|nr:outer membrane beta-barrel protein [Cyclobacteriaceae bacterium]